jgi:hypothetical protein
MAIDRNVKAYGADVVFSIPVFERLSLHARAGWVRAKAEADVSTNLESSVGQGPFFSDGSGGLTRSVSSTNGVGRFGVGADWSFTPQFALRLGWERLGSVGQEYSPNGRRSVQGGAPLLGTDAATGRATLTNWSAGLVYRFP